MFTFGIIASGTIDSHFAYQEIPEAPILYATEDDMKNFTKFVERHPEIQKYGVVKIIPHSSFKPPNQFHTVQDSRFKPRAQCFAKANAFNRECVMLETIMSLMNAPVEKFNFSKKFNYSHLIVAAKEHRIIPDGRKFAFICERIGLVPREAENLKRFYETCILPAKAVCNRRAGTIFKRARDFYWDVCDVDDLIYEKKSTAFGYPLTSFVQLVAFSLMENGHKNATELAEKLRDNLAKGVSKQLRSFVQERSPDDQGPSSKLEHLYEMTWQEIMTPVIRILGISNDELRLISTELSRSVRIDEILQGGDDDSLTLVLALMMRPFEQALKNIVEKLPRLSAEVAKPKPPASVKPAIPSLQKIGLEDSDHSEDDEEESSSNIEPPVLEPACSSTESENGIRRSGRCRATVRRFTISPDSRKRHTAEDVDPVPQKKIRVAPRRRKRFSKMSEFVMHKAFQYGELLNDFWQSMDSDTENEDDVTLRARPYIPDKASKIRKVSTYSLREFKEEAIQDEIRMGSPSIEQMEDMLWRWIGDRNSSRFSMYAADLKVDNFTSGFLAYDKLKENASADDAYYATHPWNLLNMSTGGGSVLHYLGEDVSGMTVPWVYVGGFMSFFCWHVEDHWSYSVNYHHEGSPKVWYGIPEADAYKFDRLMRACFPNMALKDLDFLHHMNTMFPPSLLWQHGIRVYKVIQRQGEFVITCPRSYHAGFNSGYNIAEAVNFATFDWLRKGRQAILQYADVQRPIVFSHDTLVLRMIKDAYKFEPNLFGAFYTELTAIIQRETFAREYLLMAGYNLGKSSNGLHDIMMPDTTSCSVCNMQCSTIFLVCKHSIISCPYHATDSCSKCRKSDFVCLSSRSTLSLISKQFELLERYGLRNLESEAWKMVGKPQTDPETPLVAILGNPENATDEEIKSLVDAIKTVSVTPKSTQKTNKKQYYPSSENGFALRKIFSDLVRTREFYSSLSSDQIADLGEELIDTYTKFGAQTTTFEDAFDMYDLALRYSKMPGAKAFPTSMLTELRDTTAVYFLTNLFTVPSIMSIISEFLRYLKHECDDSRRFNLADVRPSIKKYVRDLFRFGYKGYFEVSETERVLEVVYRCIDNELPPFFLHKVCKNLICRD